MDGLLKGKIAIITGAGSGLGRAASLIFARHGAFVAAVDIGEASVAETVRLVEAEGNRASAHLCDVADEAAVEALVADVVKAQGRLDIIYNNAAITVAPDPAKGVRGLVDTPTSELDRIQGVNVGGVLNGCRAAIRQFSIQGPGGVIVNTASIAGLIGYGGTIYGATKGAVVSLTRTLAIEIAPLGIRINSVCPGGMLTHYAGMDPDGPNADRIREGMKKNNPLGNDGNPDDSANAALFLASDLAANITGVNLPVDGGALHGSSAASADAAVAAVAALREAGEVKGFGADMADGGAIEAMVRNAADWAGRIDAVVDCSTNGPKGVRLSGLFAETDPAGYAAFLALSIGSLQHLAHASLPWLKRQGGCFIAFASDAGRFAGAHQTIVGASRAGIMGFVRNLAIEVARDGVRVHCVSPSFVAETDSARRLAANNGDRVAKAARKAGLGLPTPDDIAPLVLFLCGDGARRITGQVISVNGGMNA